MRPTRAGALLGTGLGGLILVPLAPGFFTYIGADLAYRASKIGEWARTPAAIGGCLVLLAAWLAVAGAGALVGLALEKAGSK